MFRFIALFVVLATNVCAGEWREQGWETFADNNLCFIYTGYMNSYMEDHEPLGFYINVIYAASQDRIEEKYRSLDIPLFKPYIFISIVGSEEEYPDRDKRPIYNMITIEGVEGEKYIDKDGLKLFYDATKTQKIINKVRSGENIAIRTVDEKDRSYSLKLSRKNIEIYFEMFEACIKYYSRNKYGQAEGAESAPQLP